MATESQILANLLETKSFMSRVNLPARRSPSGEAGCKSVSKQHNWPNLPRQPKPPEQKNNRHNLRGKKPKLLMAKQLTKIHPLQFSQFGVQFSAYSIAQTTISRVIRYQFKQIGAISGQNLLCLRPASARRRGETGGRNGEPSRRIRG